MNFKNIFLALSLTFSFNSFADNVGFSRADILDILVDEAENGPLPFSRQFMKECNNYFCTTSSTIAFMKAIGDYCKKHGGKKSDFKNLTGNCSGGISSHCK